MQTACKAPSANASCPDLSTSSPTPCRCWAVIVLGCPTSVVISLGSPLRAVLPTLSLAVAALVVLSGLARLSYLPFLVAGASKGRGRHILYVRSGRKRRLRGVDSMGSMCRAVAEGRHASGQEQGGEAVGGAVLRTRWDRVTQAGRREGGSGSSAAARVNRRASGSGEPPDGTQ